MDELRGEVTIIGITAGKIPWPIGKRRGVIGTSGSPVLFGSLLKAVQRESLQAVAHWFGVSKWRVHQWRAGLSVAPNNEGTLLLRKAFADEPWFQRAQRRAWTKAKDPVRNAKIAAAKQGKKRPAHVIEAVRQAHLGTKHSLTTRQQMSQSHRARGTRPPWLNPAWTKTEDKLLRTLTLKEAAERTGRTIAACSCRRRKLKLLRQV